MSKLSDRIEAAEAGSRELDGMIWCQLNGHEFTAANASGFEYVHKEQGPYCSEDRKDYTTSIDAAMTLTSGWARLAVRHLLADVMAKIDEENLEIVEVLPRLIAAKAMKARGL